MEFSTDISATGKRGRLPAKVSHMPQPPNQPLTLSHDHDGTHNPWPIACHPEGKVVGSQLVMNTQCWYAGQR